MNTTAATAIGIKKPSTIPVNVAVCAAGFFWTVERVTVLALVPAPSEV
jgi:hypothetical protein